MKTRFLGILSSVIIFFTLFWLLIFIMINISHGPVKNFAQALDFVSNPDLLFYLNYISVLIVTLLVTSLFAGLYVFIKETSAYWSMIGVIFIPAYCLLDLFAYSSQLIIIPILLDLQKIPEHTLISNFMLRLMIQQLPGSALNIYNNIAYLLLGIPSIIFGVLLYKKDKIFYLAGLLLAISGLTSIVGVFGIILENDLIGLGSLISAFFFLGSLGLLSYIFLRSKGES